MRARCEALPCPANIPVGCRRPRTTAAAPSTIKASVGRLLGPALTPRSLGRTAAVLAGQLYTQEHVDELVNALMQHGARPSAELLADLAVCCAQATEWGPQLRSGIIVWIYEMLLGPPEDAGPRWGCEGLKRQFLVGGGAVLTCELFVRGLLTESVLLAVLEEMAELIEVSDPSAARALALKMNLALERSEGMLAAPRLERTDFALEECRRVALVAACEQQA